MHLHAAIDPTRSAITEIAGDALVALYAHGSLVTGSFDVNVSDFDLVAVLKRRPAMGLANRLEQMHRQLDKDHPEWKGRIEVIYVSASDLAHFRSRRAKIAVISPGEPFHIVEAGHEWILSWYSLQEDGLALTGPPAATLIPTISFTEYLDAIRTHMQGFLGRIEARMTNGSQAYVVLTMCRGLYTCTLRSQPSKTQAADWMQSEFPEWSSLVRRALEWRQSQWDPDAQGRFAPDPELRRFAVEISRRVVELRRPARP